MRKSNVTKFSFLDWTKMDSARNHFQKLFWPINKTMFKFENSLDAKTSQYFEADLNEKKGSQKNLRSNDYHCTALKVLK